MLTSSDPQILRSLDLCAAHWRETAADVVGPVDVALPHRHAVRERTALRQLYGIDHLAGDHVALEERTHVGVGFPEIARVRRLEPDAVRAIADGREHVLDHPRLRIDSIDHPGGG